MLRSANPTAGPGAQQEPPSSQGGGLLAASPDQLQAQAMLQQAPPAPPELSLGAKSLIEDVVRELKRRYRDPGFVVPLSIKEPPIATQLPGLIEGGAHAPIAFPANPGLSAGLGMGGVPGMPADPLAGLLGGPQPALEALMGGGGAPPAADASRILNPGPPGQQPPLGFNPEDVLLL